MQVSKAHLWGGEAQASPGCEFVDDFQHLFSLLLSGGKNAEVVCIYQNLDESCPNLVAPRALSMVLRAPSSTKMNRIGLRGQPCLTPWVIVMVSVSPSSVRMR